MNKIALITGITGQDGSYLAEQLLKKGYQVNGIIRRSSSFNTVRIDHIYQDPHVKKYQLRLHYGDLTDGSNLTRLLRNIKPDEIYHLGAQSHVRVSFDLPEYTTDTIALGTLRLLDAIRDVKLSKTRFYNASSSEMFGSTPPPQSETSLFNPRSPYAIAKLFAHQIVNNYREAYQLYAVNGILFNHESPRRGKTFVTRKITSGIAQIIAGKATKIFLGNIDAKRDFGYAPEYTEMIWKMLQQKKPEDYVIATGKSHSIKEFIEEAFSLVHLDWKKYIVIDKRYMRPTEVNFLKGDAKKASQELGWKPKTSFRQLVKIMLKADLISELGDDWQSKVKKFDQSKTILNLNF